MVDKIQPLKLEDLTTGGDELDQFPTALDPHEDHVECAGIVLDDLAHRDEAVRIFRVGDDLVFQDTSNPAPHTLTELLASNVGITELQHEGLDTLTHEIDRTSFEEYLYTGSDVTSCITWTDNTRTLKIREEQYTYGTGHRVTQVVTIQYTSSGAEKMRVTETYSYSSNGRVSSTQRVKTGSP